MDLVMEIIKLISFRLSNGRTLCHGELFFILYCPHLGFPEIRGFIIDQSIDLPNASDGWR